MTHQNQYPVPSRPKKSKTVMIVVIAIAAAVGLLCIIGGTLAFHDNTSAEPTQGKIRAAKLAPSSAAAPVATTDDPEPSESPSAAQTFEAGTYEVGKTSSPDDGTIKPGTFILVTPDHCYWERLKAFDGDFDSIIANDNLEATGGKPAQARVTIKKTDKGFTLSGNCILGQKGGLK